MAKECLLIAIRKHGVKSVDFSFSVARSDRSAAKGFFFFFFFFSTLLLELFDHPTCLDTISRRFEQAEHLLLQ
jgi:hypothetical protein